MPARGPRVARATTTVALVGLARWLRDVELLHARAQRGLRVEVVHDLRVAIRRCRSLAQGLKVIDDDVGAVRWQALSDAGRALFQGLGDLRDAQVMHEHASGLLKDDPAQADVLAALTRRTTATKATARAAVASFDSSLWRAAAHDLPARAEVLLGDRCLLEHLGLRRFHEAKELHQRAMRSQGASALHELRIGIKKLRYTVENFLPDAHQQIGKQAKKLQEILGDIHDLDVLIAFLGSEHVRLHSDDRSRAASLLRSVRDALASQYRTITVGVDSAWPKLRAAFLTDNMAIARAHTTLIERRAHAVADAQASRALLRCSSTLLHALRPLLAPLRDRRAEELLRRACACVFNRGNKSVRRFVQKLPLATGFTEADRALLACVARAALERAPTRDDARVLALPVRDRALAMAAGALLHLAVPLVPLAPLVVRAREGVLVVHTSGSPSPAGARRAPSADASSGRTFAEARAPLEALLARPLWLLSKGDSLSAPPVRSRSARRVAPAPA